MWALTYPWIIIICFFAAVIVALKKHFWIAGGLVIIGLLLNWLCECFAFSLVSDKGTCSKSTIKVMAWNIDGSKFDSLKVSEIASAIHKHNPDVIFLSENFEETGIWLDSLLKKSYPYSSNLGHSGHQFYSKYLLDSIRVIKVEDYDNPLRIHVSVMVNGQSIDIYGCHLASNNYTASHVDFHLDQVNDHHDAKQYLKNVRDASRLREMEAQAIIKDMTDRATIIMGDFNDVSSSPALRTFQAAGFQDAWWKGGMGFGATIHYPLPYRIDHIMYNDRLRLKSIKKIDAKGLSDHDALVAEFYF